MFCANNPKHTNRRNRYVVFMYIAEPEAVCYYLISFLAVLGEVQCFAFMLPVHAFMLDQLCVPEVHISRQTCNEYLILKIFFMHNSVSAAFLIWCSMPLRTPLTLILSSTLRQINCSVSICSSTITISMTLFMIHSYGCWETWNDPVKSNPLISPTKIKLEDLLMSAWTIKLS